ncbi:MAG: hypothetical protein EKK57_11265 [Proteobacteria bacterium]|nr:MAG: hypothetical protein EKK57_11265 [Pseudomonadota bacterium]
MPTSLGLPSLTWQNSFNNSVAASGTALTDNRTILLGIKNALIGFASNPWIVKGSSNSVAGAMDGVDRWSGISNLVWANAGTAHSWIVLEQGGVYTSGGNKFQICIECANVSATGNLLTVSISNSAGYTGGSATNKPTATDEYVYSSATWLTGGTGSIGPIIYNVQQSTTGEATRVFCFYNSINILFWSFEKLTDAETGVTYPISTVVAGGTTTTNQATWTLLSSNTNGKARPVATNLAAWYSVSGSLGQGSGQVQTAANIYSSKWPAYIARSTVTGGHFIGKFQDCYFTSTGRNNGDAVPSGGTKVWTVVGNLLLPTGGTTLVVS